ncbi:MAG TPA: GPW/gp25 family protein [Fimbriimonas sp.]
MDFAYPLQIDRRGRTADCTYEAHVSQMIRQLLFTAPGERVNRPAFGCGLRQLLFEPNSGLLAATTQLLVQASLQQWLGNVIDVLSVEILAEDSSLNVTVAYVLRRTNRKVEETFVQEI